MLALLLEILLAVIVGLFIIHAAIETRAAKRKSALKTPETAHPAPLSSMPSVSVLLPVYNEERVVARLLNAVCQLDYEIDKLEILLLDDSTDRTGEIADQIIKRKQQQGLNIRRLRHKKPCGFKAGNLSFGLSQARSEFIAIFDADFMPPPDFLKQAMPFFLDEKVGFLQTGIQYLNADACFLTRFQAAESGHKEQVTSGFDLDGHMASLTGSSCIWRRRCIDDIGGVSSATITEDVDMGYAAQLRNWHYRYAADIFSQAELPETMAAFRVQRQRWARGLVHNAARHVKKLFQGTMSPIERLHAMALVFSPLLLALFYVLLFFTPFIALATAALGSFFHILCTIFLGAVILWAWLNTSTPAGQNAASGNRILFTIAYILLFFPLSLYYFSAIIQVAIGGKGSFHTTPKGCGRKKLRHPTINRILLALELFSFFWAVAAIVLSLLHDNYWTLLYSSLASAGFAMTLFFSFTDNLKKQAPPGHILITGASGSLGGALAAEYAAPGLKLTLLGRNSERLNEIAEKCRAKGAIAQTVQLDLRDTANVHEWGKMLAETDPPDLLIANAGLNTDIGPSGAGEPYAKTVELVQVNFLSALALVNALLPPMRKRKNGQIALISSLAACYGLPHTPVYCATKAALRTWGEALRGWLAPEGIRVSVILPGYVESPMCAAMPGPKPFLWTPEKAAQKIRLGLERNRARISFPFPLNLGIWALSLLPPWLAAWIIKILGYGR